MMHKVLHYLSKCDLSLASGLLNINSNQVEVNKTFKTVKLLNNTVFIHL